MSFLIACTLLLQDTAGETFEKIEETLRKAKTVTVKFTMEQELRFGEGAKAVRGKTTASGTLLLAGARRMNFTARIASGLPGTKASRHTFVYDGSTILAKNDSGPRFPVDEKRTERSVRGSIPAAFLRAGAVGVVAPIVSHPVGEPAPKGNLDLDKTFGASEFEWADKDGHEKSIKYRLELPDKRSYDVTLTFNSRSLLPIKRTMVGRRAGEGPATETYLEVVLDAEQPKDAFRAKLPPAEAARVANEKWASASIKTLVTGEADFRSNDRDGNKVNDYWVGDVSGLYRYRKPTARDKPIWMIDATIAEADAAPLASDNLLPHTAKQPKPGWGYLFVAIKGYEAKGTVHKYHDGTFRNHSRFGFAAYPADYPKSGKLTFIISEENRIYARDTGGNPPKAYPEDPVKLGWKLRD